MKFTRLWIHGSSKRGNTQRIFAAIDGRVDGAMWSAADLSNFPELVKMQLAVWKEGHSFRAPDMAADLATPFGDRWLRAFDTFRWKETVLGSLVTLSAVGTLDHLFPVGSYLAHGAALPAGHRMILVPNYPHGCGAVDHAAAFRALVAHRLTQKPLLSVQANWDYGNNRVLATVAGPTPDKVSLWCTTSQGAVNPLVKAVDATCVKKAVTPADTTDLRHASWTSMPMSANGAGHYQSTPPKSTLTYPACFVRAATKAGVVATSGPLLSKGLCKASLLDVR